MRRACRGLCAIVFLVSGHAAAQTTDAATAQALFDDGKRLMQAGRYEEACPKLVESQRLDPGGGTLIAIGLCHEAQGRTATAWADFNLALSEARKDRRPEREALASEHIRSLEPRMLRVRIVVSSKTPGLEVRRDSEVVGEAQWGTPVPIDPGKYSFEASAPGKRAWHDTLEATGAARTIDVAVPALEDLPPAPPPPIPSALPPPAPATALPPAPQTPAPTTGRWSAWKFVPGAVGVVAIGVGSGLGVAASSKWNASKSQCPNRMCPTAASQALSGDAGHLADASTALFAIGAVGVAASVVFLLWPSDSSSKADVRVAPLVGGGQYGLALAGWL